MATLTRHARVVFLNLTFRHVSRPGGISHGVSIKREANVFYFLVNLVLKHFDVGALLL